MYQKSLYGDQRIIHNRTFKNFFVQNTYQPHPLASTGECTHVPRKGSSWGKASPIPDSWKTPKSCCLEIHVSFFVHVSSTSVYQGNDSKHSCSIADSAWERFSSQWGCWTLFTPSHELPVSHQAFRRKAKGHLPSRYQPCSTQVLFCYYDKLRSF